MATPAQASAVTGAFQAQQAQRATTKTAGDLFSSETFLKLVGAQMKSQNPLEPMKDTEFIAQMSQFSSLEQITKLNTTMTSLGLALQLTQGSAMVGKTVSYLPEGATVPVRGTVDRVTIGNGGKDMQLVVGGVQVSPAQVVEVAGS
ncbi:MAG: flagellar hook assembly protein FlgD [Thermoleophilia bacterium]|nr:flagellar hook assembly protein FlgD [Thermoleophilia bacterium]